MKFVYYTIAFLAFAIGVAVFSSKEHFNPQDFRWSQCISAGFTAKQCNFLVYGK